MNKKITAALIVISLSSPLAASAGEVRVGGETAVKYQQNRADGQETKAGLSVTLLLNAEAGLTDNLSAYARIGAQKVSEPEIREFYSADSSRKSALALDQFGLKYTNGDFTYRLGRQDAAVGATSLLYSKPATNVGRHTFADGLSVSGRAGAADVAVLAVQEDNNGSGDNRVFAVRAGFGGSGGLAWGITHARYDDRAGGIVSSHWALDGAYKAGKHELTAELARSDRAADNRAYAATWKYGPNDKTAFFFTAFKVEANADMGDASDFGNNQRGFHYGVTHSLNDAADMEIVYKDRRELGGGKNSALEVKVVKSF